MLVLTQITIFGNFLTDSTRFSQSQRDSKVSFQGDIYRVAVN